ncbi:beta-lactamase family protein [Arthrobacter sp. zg-Y859]|uniref:Beta-lactamase n=1 Tax=Arthrobacter jinronghuae TaxID=2964609 RepID=A0ABT1NS53_9MICC|nr:serine hydrolase domain-containing protein [Arthrobacter jinronghuae]MCQ1950573.1 beta-lactamase family protein [Arthrobacter jinronghuae]UWX77539.1 beta-lactamase family protein [Arthrobacter jinronghuae]
MSKYRRMTVAVLAAAAVLAAGLLAAPWTPRLSTQVSGDAALAEAVRPLLQKPADAVSVAYLENGAVRFAGFGADERTEFEIGSVSKTFTAALLADAVERGEVTLETTVAEILGPELRDPEAEIGTVTLAELASHRSGLPRLATDPEALVSLLAGTVLHRDPYTASPAEVLEQAQSASVGGRGTMAYSNLGYAFLGQLLAKAAGMEYTDLLEQRIFEPLGMKDTYVPMTADNLRAGAPTGRNASGLSEGAWTGNGTAPMGGIRSTAADMSLYLRALLAGTAPGAGALEPQWDTGEDGEQVGLAWFTQVSSSSGRAATWHNGQTGGFSSMVAMDREAGTAVLILSNVAVGQEEAALALLKEGL